MFIYFLLQFCFNVRPAFPQRCYLHCADTGFHSLTIYGFPGRFLTSMMGVIYVYLQLFISSCTYVKELFYVFRGFLTNNYIVEYECEFVLSNLINAGCSNKLAWLKA